jgi:hypothetical protein
MAKANSGGSREGVGRESGSTLALYMLCRTGSVYAVVPPTVAALLPPTVAPTTSVVPPMWLLLSEDRDSTTLVALSGAGWS